MFGLKEKRPFHRENKINMKIDLTRFIFIYRIVKNSLIIA